MRVRNRSGPSPAPVTTVLPAIAYAERLRQLRRDGHSEERWKRTLELASIQVEAFGAAQAERLAPAALGDPEWERHARDLLILSHVHGDRVVVSDDQGPVWAGIPVVPPARAAQAVAALVRRPDG